MGDVTVKKKKFRLKKIDSSANAITITPNGSQKIDGASSWTLSTQYEAITLVSDGSNWHVE